MDASPDPRTAELLAHSRWIEALAMRLVGDPSAADDVVQSTWLAALRTGVPPRGNVRGWLARIAGNVARETHRRESARANVESHAARDESLPSSAELAARAEAETKLVEAVLSLEEPHRDVLLLRYFEGLRPEEIARRSGEPASSVSKRLTRAHARLRSRLDERGISWLAALAPIVGRQTPPLPPLIPLLLMSTAVKVLVPLALIGALAFWIRGERGGEDAVTLPTNTVAAEDSASVSDPLALSRPEASSRASAVDAPASAPPEEASTPTPAESPVAATAAVVQLGRIHGRVVRPDGKPAAARRVRLIHTPGGPVRNVVTDDAGRFDERELAAGKWAVSTQPDKNEIAQLGLPADTLDMEYLAQRVLDLAPGATIELELGAPPANPIRVSGRIHGDALPPGVLLQWIPEGEDGFDRAKFKRAAKDGAYEVVLAEPGPYNVSMILTGSPRIERKVDVPNATEFAHDFHLASGAIQGRLRTPGGEPIARAQVELTLRAGHTPLTFMSCIAYVRTTDAEGRFAFDRLDPARYALGIHGGTTAGGEKAAAIAVREIVVTSEGTPLELELVAGAGHVVRGRVLDDTGAGAHFTSLFVFDASGEPLDPLNPATSDKQGAFTLPALAPGHYTVVGARGLQWTEMVEIAVLAQNTDIELHVRDAAIVEVRGEDLGDSWIDVRDASGNCFSPLLDRNVFNGAVTRAYWISKWRYLVPQGDYEVRALDGTGVVVASTRVATIAGETKQVTLAR